MKQVFFCNALLSLHFDVHFFSSQSTLYGEPQNKHLLPCWPIFAEMLKHQNRPRVMSVLKGLIFMELYLKVLFVTLDGTLWRDSESTSSTILT